jgi:Tat protein secretion system quality control protein TatD with DNase activity
MCGSVGGRIMTIHSRRAAGPVLDALASRADAGVPVLHWFSGSRRELQRAIDQGCWFSVGPAMFNGERGRGLAAMMPRDRILTESDGPFAQIEGRPLFYFLGTPRGPNQCSQICVGQQRGRGSEPIDVESQAADGADRSGA